MLKEFCDNSRQNNTCIIRGPRRRRKRRGLESLHEEITAENFTNPGKEIDFQVMEVQKAPNKMHPKVSTPKHTVM